MNDVPLLRAIGGSICAYCGVNFRGKSIACDECLATAAETGKATKGGRTRHPSHEIARCVLPPELQRFCDLVLPAVHLLVAFAQLEEAARKSGLTGRREIDFDSLLAFLAKRACRSSGASRAAALEMVDAAIEGHWVEHWMRENFTDFLLSMSESERHVLWEPSSFEAKAKPGDEVFLRMGYGRTPYFPGRFPPGPAVSAAIKEHRSRRQKTRKRTSARPRLAADQATDGGPVSATSGVDRG